MVYSNCCDGAVRTAAPDAKHEFYYECLICGEPCYVHKHNKKVKSDEPDEVCVHAKRAGTA